jgi:hypothetical protein
LNEIPNKPLENGIGNFGRTKVINIITFCIKITVCKSRIINMATMRLAQAIFEYSEFVLINFFKK